MSSPTKEGSQIIELESVRALMAWWVVFGHLYYFLSQKISLPAFLVKLLAATAIPVDIFICLSGFVITLALLNASSPTYSSFIRRRFFRIAPTYAILMAIAIISFDLRMDGRELIVNNLQSLSLKDYREAIENNFHIYLFLVATLLQGAVPDNIAPHAGDAFLAPAWSLSLEWQFYLLAPFLFSAIYRRKLLWIVLLVSALLSSALSILNFKFSYGAFLPLKLHLFLLGMSSALILNGKMRKTAAKWLFLAAVGATALSNPSLPAFASIFAWAGIISIVSCPPDIIQRVKPIGTIRTILKNGFFRHLGLISYPTYLSHILVIDFLILTFEKFSLPIDPLTFSSVAILTTYVVSLLVHAFIEKPAVRFAKSKRVKAENTTPVLPGT